MIKLLIIVSVVTMPTMAFSSNQVGTITQIENEAKIFSHPGKNVQGPPPHALYEGEYYSVKDAKVGDRLENGNIVRTAPGGKARIVYDNGDQFNLGSGTAYRVFWDKNSTKPKINLMYGKLRGIVEKGGPRGRLTIRTRTATMGVRGTDFFIAEGGPGGGTEVSILRGAVEVKPELPKAKSVEVKAGYSAEILPSKKPEIEKQKERQNLEQAIAPVVELRRTTKEDLTAIKRSSEVKIEIKREIALTDEVSKKVEQLETKAVETTLKDIKKSDPKLFAQIQDKPIKTTEELNAKAVDNLMKNAPKAPAKRKPYKSELEDLESGAYEKYFKIVD